MTTLEYPREWFKVTVWLNAPKPQMFARETTTRIYHELGPHGRFEMKKSGFAQWYPTREEAQAAIDGRNERAAKQKADGRIRAYAPELLEALQKARNTLAGCGMEHIAADICDSVIAKATGGAA